VPYSRNNQLPDAVRNALPSDAQSIWRSAYNAAAKKGWDEGRCASYAWGAVKAAGFKKSKSGRWSKMDIFLSDAGGTEVHLETREDGTALVKGLPLMHPGQYKGRDYTVDYLRQIAANFGRQKSEDSFEPPLLPRHSFDSEGKPTGVTDAEVRGHFEYGA